MAIRSVLVTGASTGLGRAATAKLAANGFYVFAAARNVSGVFHDTTNVEELPLDITDELSVSQAFTRIADRTKDHPLWGLVNNAGICIPSPIELLGASELRRQLETNLIGQLVVTQAALPDLRAQKGRIINVTSGLGSIAVPYLGAYSIAQFAKMAFTDILRRELRNAGVTVSVIQPGEIQTPIWDKFVETGRDLLRQAPADKAAIYGRSFEVFLSSAAEGAKVANTSVDDFAAVVVDAFTADTPKSHYFVGDDAKAFVEKARSEPPDEIDKWFTSHSPTASEFYPD